jgi:TPP-dependent pyruvate/acetoin dehydrogenase alpha subunit
MDPKSLTTGQTALTSRPLDPRRHDRLFGQMYLIRAFETRLLELFSQGRLFGTTHTYVGQEANAVSVIDHLGPNDIIFSNHRCHGHYLTRHDDPEGLLAEIMGRTGGVCGGRGGSQHLQKDNFYSHGVQGGFLPIVVGMALAERLQGKDAVVVAFIGDGTFGEGIVYEALNMASLWSVPLLVVVENNRYAQSTPIEVNTAGKLIDRARAFGISAGEIESSNLAELQPRFGRLIDGIRGNARPHVEIVHTYRFNAHSKGDDDRDPAEIDVMWRDHDPLEHAKAQMDEAVIKRICRAVDQRLAKVEAAVEAMPFASLPDHGYD